MKKKNCVSIIIFAVALVILTFLDQITKIGCESLKGKDGYPVIKNVFEFYYLENTGTAWGMFSGGIPVFLILTVIIMIFIIYIVTRIPFEKKYYALLFSCILIASGAVGNFIDRLFLGYVRDFLYFKLIDFPVFNVADVYVTIGTILLILSILFVYDEKTLDQLLKIKKVKSK